MDLAPAMFVLIRAAVHNPANAFFLLLSESCVPLYPAAVLYLQVVHTPKSRLDGARALSRKVPHRASGWSSPRLLSSFPETTCSRNVLQLHGTHNVPWAHEESACRALQAAARTCPSLGRTMSRSAGSCGVPQLSSFLDLYALSRLLGIGRVCIGADHHACA